jgi:hypothetical protein
MLPLAIVSVKRSVHLIAHEVSSTALRFGRDRLADVPSLERLATFMQGNTEACG